LFVTVASFFIVALIQTQIDAGARPSIAWQVWAFVEIVAGSSVPRTIWLSVSGNARCSINHQLGVSPFNFGELAAPQNEKTSYAHRLPVHVSPQLTHFYAQIPTNPKRRQPTAIDFPPNYANADTKNFHSPRKTHTFIRCVSRFVHFVWPLGFRAISS